jgi:hypothetical protein
VSELDGFHELSDRDLRGAVVAEPDNSLNGSALRAIALGKRSPRTTLQFKPALGSRLEDLLTTTWIVPLLLSPRFHQLLRDHDFTGWTAHPAEVELRRGERAEYGALAVSGRSGPIDDKRSERVVLPPAAPGGNEVPGLRGLLFDPRSWDGSDVFTPEGSTFVLVTDRVRDAIAAAGLTNVALERITEIERMAVD